MAHVSLHDPSCGKRAFQNKPVCSSESFDKMSTSAERLEKLNAYLVSKGRQPKNAGPVNFVKKNRSSIKRAGSTSILSIATDKRKKDDRNTPSQKEKQRSMLNNPRTPVPPKRHRRSQNVGETSSKENKAATPCQMRSIKTPVHKTQVSKPNESMRKKLVRRSISIANKSQIHTPKNLSKTPQKNRHPLTPSSRTNASVRQGRLLCKSAGPALKKVSRIGQFQRSEEKKEQAVLHERLNRWLIAKGKKPLDGQKLRGFKPAKTIATPVGSPVCTPKPNTKGGSHWQGLREEDNTDELTVLIRNMMQDVQKCVQECCPPEIIRKTLDVLAEQLPKVKLHATFWVTLAQVEQYAGKTDQQICDLFEQAIIEKAQPIEDIQKAINSMVLQKVEKSQETHRLCSKSPEDSASLMPLSHMPIPTHQLNTPNPTISKLIDYERPVFKNAATSPIVFESPKRTLTEQLLTANSPSSVVKLRMVAKSSPVFKRLKLLRTLPDDASAIVTPVRRSRRIADAHDSYPKSLQDHEPCLSTVQEIFPALKQQSSAGNQNASVAYDIVFDPNLALGKDFSDISTVLKF